MVAFGLDAENIRAELSGQAGSSYDSFMELNSRIEDSLCDLFDYSESKTFLINNLFFKI